MEVAGVEIEFSDGIAAIALLVSMVAIVLTELRHRQSQRSGKAARFIFQDGPKYSTGNVIAANFHNIGPHDAYSVVGSIVEPDIYGEPVSLADRVPTGDKLSVKMPVSVALLAISEDWSATYRVDFLDGNGKQAQTFRVRYRRNKNQTWSSIGSKEVTQ